MDKEKLIRVVKSKKPLWDRSNKYFRNRDHTKELWQEVAEEMCQPCDVVKKKWTGLRDVFRREWKHIYAARVCGGGDMSNLHKKSTWPFLENMLFLAPQMVFHEPLDNQTDPDIKEEQEESSFQSYPEEMPFEAQFEEGVVFEPLKIEERLGNCTAEIQKIVEESTKQDQRTSEKRVSSFVDSFCEPEEKRFRYSDCSDSDTQFLMSLVPFLKAVPLNRKMTVRTKLQQVFLEEETRVNRSQGCFNDDREVAVAPVASSSTSVSSNSVSSPTVD